jgi:hypothetical protein
METRAPTRHGNNSTFNFHRNASFSFATITW